MKLVEYALTISIIISSITFTMDDTGAAQDSSSRNKQEQSNNAQNSRQLATINALNILFKPLPKPTFPSTNPIQPPANHIQVGAKKMKMDTQDQQYDNNIFEQLPEVTITFVPSSQDETLESIQKKEAVKNMDLIAQEIDNEASKAILRAFTIDMETIQQLNASAYEVMTTWLRGHCKNGSFTHPTMTKYYFDNIIAEIEKEQLYYFPENVRSMPDCAHCTSANTNQIINYWSWEKTKTLPKEKMRDIVDNSLLPPSVHMCAIIPAYFKQLDDNQKLERERRYSFDSVSSLSSINSDY